MQNETSRVKSDRLYQRSTHRAKSVPARLRAARIRLLINQL